MTLEYNRDNSLKMQGWIRKQTFSPQMEKTLRRFSSWEVSELIFKVNQSTFRGRLMADPGLPDGEVEEDGRQRWFSLEEINEMRRKMKVNRKGLLPYRPQGKRAIRAAIANFKGGAGKSTVIDAITGRRPLTRGQVILDGQDVSQLGAVARRRLGLSRSFQRTSIFNGMPVRKQVELASYKMGMSDSAADAEAVLEELDLARLGNVMAEDLGYGEQRRLDLGLALVGRPTVLLLDEPMAGLSVKESLDLAQHLKALTSRWEVSVLLVEHDMDVVFGISDVITVFELGRVIAQGAPAEVRANPRVREAYLGSTA